MLLTASDIQVNLAVLDNEDGTIASMTATLQQLHEDRAILFLPTQSACTCLRWGSRVRFWMVEGVQGYEVTGAVVAHDPPTDEEPGRKVIVRLWECYPRQQRRALPRRNLRFPITLCMLEGEAASSSAESSSEEASSSISNLLQEGWCIDIGAGGMRIRTSRRETWTRHLELRFTLPGSAAPSGGQTPTHQFRLVGRVLRVTPARRDRGSVEIAIKFEQLTVEDGLSLAAFLSA